MADSGGTTGSHPEKTPLPILVAPTTEVSLNTIKAFLIPVNCWRVDDLRFAFDSSVVHREIKTEMGLLATLRNVHPGAPMSIFGHADPTGDDTREQGAQAIVRAFEAAHLPDIRMVLFAEMESRNYFQEELGPDPTNVVILSAWLRAILHETDEDRRGRFLTHLASTLGSKLADEPGKDRVLREKFAPAVQDPRRAEVGRVLRAAVAAHPGDPLFQNLAEAWAH